MNQYRFWMIVRPTTPYDTVTFDTLAAANMHDAIEAFCQKYHYDLLSLEEEHIWVEDPAGADMKYAIERFDN